MRAHLSLPIALAICARAHADPPIPADPEPTEPDPALVEADPALVEADPALVDPTADETIVVESSPPLDTPSGGVRFVTARELELTPRRHTDDLLRVVPGLYMSQHGSEGKGQQFFLRGFDAVHGSDIAIRVAGIPINEVSNVHGQGYVDLGFVIPETVTGLTSRKGPFDLEHGWFATAGSIDLDLGAATRGRRVGYELGTTNRHRVAVIDAPVDGPQAEVVAAELVHDDGYGAGRGTERAALLGQTELDAGRLQLRPMAAGYWSEFGEPGLIAREDLATGYFDRGSAPADNLDGRSQRLLAGVRATWYSAATDVTASTYLGWRSLELTQNFTGFLENPQLGDAREQAHRALTGGGRVTWRRRVRDRVRVIGGGELVRDQLVQAEQRVSTMGAVWRDERSLDASTTSLGGWLGGEARHRRWSVVGGARVDAMFVDATDLLAQERSGNGAVAAISPRLAVAWRGEGGAVTLAAGRGVRPPEARAFTRRESRENMDASVFDGGDPDITKATAVELGGELRRAKIVLGATAFATWIERESVFDHVSGVSVLRDGSRRFGGELSVEARLVSWLALRGDVTAVDARYVVSGNPVPGAPRLLASGEVRLDRSPWSAGLAGRFLGARPLTHGATAAAATVFDAVAARVYRRWTFAAQIDNLLGTNWNEGEYHFASHWDPSTPSSAIPRVHISPGRPFGVRAGATLQF